jgi:hypothetical protein
MLLSPRINSLRNNQVLRSQTLRMPGCLVPMDLFPLAIRIEELHGLAAFAEDGRCRR